MNEGRSRRAGLTVRDVAQLIGVTPSRVSQIEKQDASANPDERPASEPERSQVAQSEHPSAGTRTPGRSQANSDPPLRRGTTAACLGSGGPRLTTEMVRLIRGVPAMLSGSVLPRYGPRMVADDVRSSARPVYSIGAVSRMLDVATSTLRSWEERYGVVMPDRSGGGQRLYSRDQVDQLRFIAGQIDAGLQAGEAHRLLEMDRTTAGDGPHESGGASDRRQVLVLLAERDRFAAELGEYLLRTEGFDVVVALDVAEAAAISAEAVLDLAVVELLISAGGGTDLCRQLSGSGVRVLATSVLDLRAEALRAGADAFLAKPFEPLQLVSTVRDLLGMSALTRPSPERAAR